MLIQSGAHSTRIVHCTFGDKILCPNLVLSQQNTPHTATSNLAGCAAYNADYTIVCVHQCDRCGRFDNSA